MKKPPSLAHDFWPNFRRGTISIAIVIELVVLLLTAGVLAYFDFFEDHLDAAIIILVSQALIGAITSALILMYAIRPTRDLLSAIVHIAGEPTNLTPPNPNNPRYAKNGFKSVLQTLYELDSKRDATETQPQEVTVTTSSDPLRLALDTTTCGFVVMDHNRNITYANKAAPVNIGEDGISRLQLLFTGDDTLDNWLNECEQSAVHAEKTWARLPDHLPDDENRRFFDVLVSYNKGAAAETVIALVDRTKLYEVGEEELDFIAFAAHELRGPITVIRGYVDVLQGELGQYLQPDQKELFHRLTVSANRLSGYVNNILNTSRYDRRHLVLHLSEQSVSGIYNIIRDDMALRASAQNRLLNVNIPEDLPTIAADTASLSEVMANLIDNAIKYSNEGGAITVKAEPKGNMVEFSVIDQGIGMPASVIGNLFQKFYRSHRSRETVSGTGIGLYISKGIVESHGGTISVRSEEGRGSTFMVDIPTYASVAEKLKAGDNNTGLIEQGRGWIKNHSMYRS